MHYSKRMRQLFYPFLDKRSPWILAGATVLQLTSLLLVFGFVGLQTGGLLDDQGWRFLAALVFLAAYSVLALGGVLYVGTLVASNREGFARTDCLPSLRSWRRMLKDGLVSCFVGGFAMVAPYLVFMLAAAVFGVVVCGFSLTLGKVDPSLGAVAGLLTAGGFGLTVLLVMLGFVAIGWVMFPLLQARYACTGELSSFFRWGWALKTVARMPGKFLLYQAPTLTFFSFVTVAHLVTLGLASVVLGLAIPFVQLNQAYLMGYFYAESVDPVLADIVPRQS